MAMTVNASTLAGIDAFRDMPLEQREKLAARMRGQHHAAGSRLISETDTSGEVYFLVSGRVRATLFSRTGREITFQDLEPGQMFGELSAIDGQPRSTNVVALEDCLVLVLGPRDFSCACAEYPAFGRHIMRRLATLTRMLLERVFEFSTLAVNHRIHAELLRLARRNAGQGEQASIEIRNAPTHAELANRLSTHREAVTRELKRLEKLGVVDWGRSRHRVLDIRKLSAMVEQPGD